MQGSAGQRLMRANPVIPTNTQVPCTHSPTVKRSVYDCLYVATDSDALPSCLDPYFMSILTTMASSTPDDALTTFGLSGDKLRESIASLTADARSVLQDKLLYSKPSVDLSKLTDDLNEHQCASPLPVHRWTARSRCKCF